MFTTAGNSSPMHSKQARGLVTRYVAKNQVKSLEELKMFNLEGYEF
jgi:cytoplasmic iron level regulating protein YaaA (DUF328/UPF0246 family)